MAVNKAKRGHPRLDLKILLIGIILLSIGLFLAYSELAGWFGYAPRYREIGEIVGMWSIILTFFLLGFAHTFVTLENAEK